MEAILKANPQVSAEWLMRGEGEMFLTGEQPAASVIHIDKSTRTVGGNGVAGDGNTTGADALLVEQLRKENAALQERVKEAGEQIRNKDEQIAKLLDLLAK